MTAILGPRLGAGPVHFETRGDGSTLVRPAETLGPYPARLTERLEHWARATPDAVFLARRGAGDAWVRVTYAAALVRVRALAQALLDRDLSAARPVAILSGNDLEHALLALACLHAGVPYAPVSPAYALVSSDFGKLRHVLGLLTPGLVFAADGAAFGPALRAAAPADAEVVVARGADAAGRPATSFATLEATVATVAVDHAAAAVGPDTVAKLLFTSGSTGLPKGVVNTQRMLCSNQQMIREAFPVLAEAPPVLVDWLPWNHTFGGNHNLGLVLYNGGALWIDDGKPTPGGIAETVRNLREISPTVYFNVPKGFEELVPYLRAEPALRATFFRRLRMLFFAGAGLSQHVWDALDALARAETGRPVPMMTGLGATETGPFALCCREDAVGSGVVGLPVPGCELKLAPVDGKLEARVRGPAVTPGYWRAEAQTRDAFDEEGFYRLGDALVPLDPADPQRGFRFDGRIAEDFKLSSGTWVSVGPLRARVLAAFAPYLRDVVVAGHDREHLAVLLVPDEAALRDLRGGDGDQDPAVLAEFGARLRALAATATGGATRITRAVLLTGPLSIDAGEVTDKGSVNQRAVLRHRPHLVEALYARPCGPHVIALEETPA